MKKLFFIAFLSITSLGFAQEDGIMVKKNSLTTKEIPPVWPGCENTEVDKKTCWNQQLVKHLKSNYKFPRDANGKIIRGKAIVSFNINEKGKVEILKVEGPEPAVNAEAKRIIMAIPQMKPGKLAGKPVSIGYKVPFTF